MDKYLNYKAEDFAIEESFINWVKETKPNDINFWNKWILDHPEKKEDVTIAKEIVESLVFLDEEVLAKKESEIWNKISSHIDDKQVPQNNTTSIFRFLMPIAAAAMVGLLIFFNLPQEFVCDTHINSGIAETNEVNLPDNSVVTVNRDSKLCYSKETWDGNRIVELEGEAFFEVEKGSKFTVQTVNGNVEVLGTSFNVYSRNGQLFVECETGKVKVTSQGNEAILMPNENVKLDLDENLVEKSEIKSKRSEWRGGTFNYNEENIANVLDDMERTFGVDIELSPELDGQLYNGRFVSENIDTALYQVLWPLNLEAIKSGNGYKVQSSKK